MAASQRRVLVVDNGGATIKAGYAGGEPITIHNCVVKPKASRRMYMADAISECKDFSSLYVKRPYEKGFCVDWNLQTEIWSRIFRKEVLDAKPEETTLLVTEPLLSPDILSKELDEVVFEEFGFNSYCRMPAAVLAKYGYAAAHPNSSIAFSSACCVLDAGFSNTHAVPIFSNTAVNYGVRRLDLGGKALTNYLKELISYRQLNMMDESWVVNDVKEQCCYTALDYEETLAQAAMPARTNPIRCRFALPNFVAVHRGYILEDNLTTNTSMTTVTSGVAEGPPKKKQRRNNGSALDSTEPAAAAGSSSASGNTQVLTLTNERVSVPELLFSPQDIGLDQSGVAELIVQAIANLPPAVAGLMYDNIMLTGGCVRFPGFQARLDTELRKLVPTKWRVTTHIPEDPVMCAWRGGSALGLEDRFPSMTVTKAAYKENGSELCHRTFYWT